MKLEFKSADIFLAIYIKVFKLFLSAIFVHIHGVSKGKVVCNRLWVVIYHAIHSLVHVGQDTSEYSVISVTATLLFTST